MTWGQDLRTLDDISNLVLQMTLSILGHELKALNTLNNSRLWLI